jgi:hypothetical protein
VGRWDLEFHPSNHAPKHTSRRDCLANTSTTHRLCTGSSRPVNGICNSFGPSRRDGRNWGRVHPPEIAKIRAASQASGLDHRPENPALLSAKCCNPSRAKLFSPLTGCTMSCLTCRRASRHTSHTRSTTATLRLTRLAIAYQDGQSSGQSRLIPPSPRASRRTKRSASTWGKLGTLRRCPCSGDRRSSLRLIRCLCPGQHLNRYAQALRSRQGGVGLVGGRTRPMAVDIDGSRADAGSGGSLGRHYRSGRRPPPGARTYQRRE